jgi:hypothetical protein
MIDPERAGLLASSLAVDGYRMEIAETGARLRVTIVATPHACPDCLVPKELMRGLLGQALGVPADAIDLAYPRDAAPLSHNVLKPGKRGIHVPPNHTSVPRRPRRQPAAPAAPA